MNKHKNTYPYEWYVYKDDSDICPDCGNKPRDYRVPSSHISVHPPVIFQCANGHRYGSRRQLEDTCYDGKLPF